MRDRQTPAFFSPSANELPWRSAEVSAAVLLDREVAMPGQYAVGDSLTATDSPLLVLAEPSPHFQPCGNVAKSWRP